MILLSPMQSAEKQTKRNHTPPRNQDINLKASPWKPYLNDTEEPKWQKVEKFRVLTTSNCHAETGFSGKAFLSITLQVLSHILWLKSRKQNNKHLEMKHSHISLRESSITMCYSLLKDKETDLATFPLPSSALTGTEHASQNTWVHLRRQGSKQ